MINKLCKNTKNTWSHKQGHFDGWIILLHCDFSDYFFIYRIDVSLPASFFRRPKATFHSICKKWISSGENNIKRDQFYFLQRLMKNRRESIPVNRKRIIDIILALLYMAIPQGSISKSSSERELLLPKDTVP